MLVFYELEHIINLDITIGSFVMLIDSFICYYFDEFGWIRSATRYEICVLRNKWLNFGDMGWCQILESVLKDLDIIDRRLHKVIMNSSLSVVYVQAYEIRLRS